MLKFVLRLRSPLIHPSRALRRLQPGNKFYVVFVIEKVEKMVNNVEFFLILLVFMHLYLFERGKKKRRWSKYRTRGA